MNKHIFGTQLQIIWSVFVLISRAPFLGGIREPRGCNWPFPSHSMLYHFHSSIYHWRKMEKGHSVCVFSAHHHHCDYMRLIWRLSQISTLEQTSLNKTKDGVQDVLSVSLNVTFKSSCAHENPESHGDVWFIVYLNHKRWAGARSRMHKPISSGKSGMITAKIV